LTHSTHDPWPTDPLSALTLSCWITTATVPLFCLLSAGLIASGKRTMGVGAKSTLGGKTFLPEKYVWKINKMPEFTWFFPENYQNTRIFMIFAQKKLTEFPNFTRFCPKNARILHNNCPKIYFFFWFFFFWGGGCSPPAPVSYAYEKNCHTSARCH